MLNTRLTKTAALCALFIGTGIEADAQVLVKLEIKEPANVVRQKTPITTGIPLPRGLVGQPGEVVLLDSSGKQLPAQFDVQSHWIRGNTIRWLEVDAQISLNPGELKNFSLARRPAGTKDLPTALKVKDGEDSIMVITGPLAFSVSKKAGSGLFKGVWLDQDRNGKFGKTEQMLRSIPGDGFTLLETGTGKWHSSSGATPKSVTVEKTGSMRVVVKVDGTHAAEGGVKDGCYDYTARIHAYAGKPYVKIQYTLKNTRFTSPFRAWQFSSGGLKLGLADRNAANWTIGGQNQVHTGGAPAAGSRVSIYQDSDGSPKWNKVRPHIYSVWKDGDIPGVTFKGYRLRQGKPGAWKELGKGDYAPGWVDLSGRKGGMTAIVPHFAPQYPKALDVRRGQLDLLLFAPYGKRKHYIEVLCTKTHDIVLDFHRGACDPKNAATLMKSFENPIIFLPSAKWVANTKAWDLDLFDPGKPREWKGSNPNFRFMGRSGGWERFGAPWGLGDLNSGGSHPQMDTMLGLYIQTGDYRAVQKTLPEARAMVSYIPWGPDGYLLTPGKKPHNVRVHGKHPIIPDNVLTGKPAFTFQEYEFYRYYVGHLRHSPYLKPYGKYFKVFDGYAERKFNRADSGHFGMFPVTESYHLTGDPVLREGLQRIAQVVKFQISHRDGECPGYQSGARYQGWYQTGLAQIYNCTDDKTILKYLGMTALPSLRGLRTHPRGWWGNAKGEKLFMMSGLVQGLYENWRLTRNEDARDAIIAACDWAVHFAHYIPKKDGGNGFPYFWEPADPAGWHGQGKLSPHRLTIFARGYLVSGRKDIYGMGEDLASFDNKPLHPAYQPWYGLEQRPKKDTTPPAAVKDLTVSHVSNGLMRVSFTSSGDDGDRGTPSEYQFKFSPMPIVETIKWPEQKDTHRAFWWAHNYGGEPRGVPAGRKVSFMLKQKMKPGKTWFALKSYDEESNISELSNVVLVEYR